MTQNKTYSLLGLAAGARKLSQGATRTEAAVKSGEARLVIAAGDVSANTMKKFKNMCTYYEVPFYIFGDRESLGHAVGGEPRAVLAVTDDGFAAGLEKLLHTE